MKMAIITEDAPMPVGHYSQAIKAGNLVFASGQIPIDPRDGEIVRGDIKEQTEQILKNLQAVLKAGDSSLNKAVKITVFLKNLDNFAQLNSVFEDYFKGEPPARETVEVSRLPKDVEIEISAIAATSNQTERQEGVVR